MLVAALYCYHRADNPRRCPTVEDLVNERYLAETGARGIDIRCDSGEVELLEPASPAPTFRMKWKRRTCGALASVWSSGKRRFGC